MPTTDEPVRTLSKGANIALRDVDAELGSVLVILEAEGSGDQVVDADVSVLLLGADGQVRSSDDLVFYNQPIALGGAVHLRDKIRTVIDDGTSTLSADLVTLELDDVPEDVQRIVLCASLDPSTGMSFGDARSIALRIQRSADAVDLLEFAIGDAGSETAMIFGEFYRRAGDWRVRAVGQGYEDGLAALIAEHGVKVDASDTDGDAGEVEPETEAATASNVAADVQEVSDEVAAAGRVPAPQVEPAAVRAVSVRRATRPPRLPSDWNTSIPAGDASDWQPARLFPVAGIGGAEEQERRATSALLSVMALVREFGRSLMVRCGAPAGVIDSFIEVPFGHGDEAYRPDGVIRVSRGRTQWTALVEVKTSDGSLRVDQVDHYVDIARAKGFDAVLTISNELTGASVDHPLAIDRRKLRKVALLHLSWDQIRTDAIVLVRKGGVSDATQARILAEFVRYMEHPRSGMHGFTDMGSHWVRVRDSVKAKTLRPSDRSTEEVSAKFDQLVQHVGLHLTRVLGVEVQAAPPRNAPDVVTRCQQLADSGLLFGGLRVPGAADVIVLNADLRTDRVGCSLTIDSPKEGRPLTKVNWLLRQLPPNARDGVRVEAQLTGGRGATTAQLLGALRADPEKLLPPDGRDIRAFKVVLETPIGTKRAAGSGGLIHSVRGTVFDFYAEVVQHLRPWSARPPKLPDQAS